MKAARPRTLSDAKHRLGLRSLTAALVLVFSMLACTTGGYWVPPKATDTPQADIAFLLESTPTDIPALDPPPVETATD